jgi:hypothetical protein
MSFLAPALLVALPLAGLPILIHLINQRRFQNIEWSAMRFLLEANRMSRGYARIRQWLILLFRTLAVATLLFAIARPLAGGWLGLASGGRADTTLVLVDRSASMQESGSAARSKLATGVAQIADTLNAVGSSRWVLVDSVNNTPQELESPTTLAKSPHVTAASASADLPAMLQAAHDYIRTNRAGQTEIWICSDLRANDWNAASDRWRSLRESFLEFPQTVRFHLLAYPQPEVSNLAVRLTDVRRYESSDGATLLVSLLVSRSAEGEKVTVPVQFEVEGARSQIDVELDGREVAVRDHIIPLEENRKEGWGRVSIPADENPADNEFYFVFAEAPARRTVIVAESGAETRPLELAAGIAPLADVEAETAAITPDQLPTVAWEETALLVWQAPLPQGKDAELVQSFIDDGGQAIFLPPANPTDASFLDLRWTEWKEPAEPTPVDTWRSDQDLLARTQSGAALPVGELLVRRYCGLKGEATPLAELRDRSPLLARASTEKGGAYFLATTTAVKDSSLATNGVALYALMQRALAEGTRRLSRGQQLTAGEATTEAVAWRQVAGAEGNLSTEYAAQSGVYSAGERTLAVNRGVEEDRAAVLDAKQVERLFDGLHFDRVDDAAGSGMALTREIWRLFLVGMVGALVVEAGLCLPRKPRTAGGVA